jgi:hypothetical protein
LNERESFLIAAGSGVVTNAATPRPTTVVTGSFVLCFDPPERFTPVAFYSDERVRLIRFEPETDACADLAYAKATVLEAREGDGGLLISLLE